jgi:hypothetical protein
MTVAAFQKNVGSVKLLNVIFGKRFFRKGKVPCMNHNRLRSDYFIVALNNFGLHFFNRCKRTVTILDDVCVPIVFIGGEKECGGRVQFFPARRVR